MKAKTAIGGCALVAGGVVLLLAGAAQAALVGASPYTNLLAGATNTSFGLINTPLIIMTDNGALSGAIDGGVGPYGISYANKYTPYANNGPVFFEWELPSGTFSARTFITEQGGAYNGPFTQKNPYQLSTNDGGGPLVNVAGHAGAGLPLTSPFVVTSSATPITASKVRVTFSELYETSGLGFAVMQEVIAVSDQLVRVPISGASSPNNLNAGIYPPSAMFDNNEHTGWASPGNIGDTITVTLAQPADLGAIMITGIEPRSEKFDIYFNGSVTPSVTGVEWAGLQNYALLKLDAIVPAVTSITLQFTAQSFTGSNPTPEPHYLGEIIPFEVPEPASAALLGATGLAVLLRRERGRR